ncbi:MAG: transporter substrate-binding domain-containing protein [Oscillospiraceae bacterium]|nr:transporter substrate-binding domain-containing protein [Oscillospiraceae bacterium]
MKKTLMALLMTAALGVTACSGSTASPAGNSNGGDQAAQKETFTRVADLKGHTIGVQAGTSMGDTVTENIPDAIVSQYRNYTFLVDALKKGEIAAFPADDPVVKELCNKDSALTYINEAVDPGDFAFAFPKTDKGDVLLGQFNEYIAKLESNGDMQKLIDKWLGADDSVKVVEDYTKFPANNGTLKFATEGDYAPFDYFRNDQLVGIDIELAIGFCKEYGYGLEVTTMSFGDIIPSVWNGNYDFAGAGITVTDERKEQVNFSTPNYTGGILFCVLK